MNSFVDVVELSNWPKKVIMKSIPEVEDIFYMNCRWKSVDRDIISHDIFKKGNQSVFHAFRNSLLVSANNLRYSMHIKNSGSLFDGICLGFHFLLIHRSTDMNRCSFAIIPFFLRRKSKFVFQNRMLNKYRST